MSSLVIYLCPITGTVAEWNKDLPYTVAGVTDPHTEARDRRPYTTQASALEAAKRLSRVRRTVMDPAVLQERLDPTDAPLPPAVAYPVLVWWRDKRRGPSILTWNSTMRYYTHSGGSFADTSGVEYWQPLLRP